MYLITQQQFIEVFEQETQSNNINIDFNQLIEKGSLIIKDRSWYGKGIYLGDQNNFPIITFTNRRNLTDYTKPDASYLKIIIRGIQEAFGYNTEMIIDYFIDTPGIRNNYSMLELRTIIES